MYSVHIQTYEVVMVHGHIFCWVRATWSFRLIYGGVHFRRG